MKNLVSLAFLLLFISACSEGHRRIESFRWTAVSPLADSLTEQLDYGFVDYEPAETLSSKITKLEEALRGGLGDDSIALACRMGFWRGRLYQRIGYPDSALEEIRYAYEICDSARLPYEFYRLRGLLRQLERIGGTMAYRQLDEELRFYQGIGDLPMTAVAYINLGSRLYHVGEYARSLEYLKKGNEINSVIGFRKMLSKNSINIANVEFILGNDDEGRRILLGLLDSDDLEGDSSTVNLIYRNLYAHTDEIDWLFKAYEGVRNDHGSHDLKGLYTAMLSKYFFDKQQPDSGVFYSEIAYSCLPAVASYENRASVLDVYASRLEIKGEIDSALQMRKQMELYIDSANIEMQRDDVVRLSNVREIQLAIAAERERAQKMKLNFLGVIFVVLIVAGIVFFLFYRRYQRDQIARRDNRLEIEKEQRRLLALTLAMEEKNNTFQSILDEIARMRKEGTIDSSGAAIVQNIVKMHLAGAEERDSFRRMFVTVNPEFVRRLQERCPDLSESYVKLATYIYIGLDNSQIARLLVIRPESVKQARWRLRKQLGLGKDESLDDTIRSLV